MGVALSSRVALEEVRDATGGRFALARDRNRGKSDRRLAWETAGARGCYWQRWDFTAFLSASPEDFPSDRICYVEPLSITQIPGPRIAIECT